MASTTASAIRCPSAVRFSSNPSSVCIRPAFVSFRFSSANFGGRKCLSIRANSASVAPAAGVAPPITLTENALKHLNRMRSERSENLCLRIGVKQGGCSGMSYIMDFESKENARPDDYIIEYNGFTIVCDPKSLLFIFGMQLDYSDALIGGGFSFKNPNATQTCGCGKSFNAEMLEMKGDFGVCICIVNNVGQVSDKGDQGCGTPVSQKIIPFSLTAGLQIIPIKKFAV